MERTHRAVLLAVVLVVAASAVSVTASKCPSNVPACQQGGLNVTAYAGVWYEMVRSKAFQFDDNCYCTTAHYTLDQADARVLVNNTCRKGGIDGKPDSVTGYAVVKDPSKPCDLSVKFPQAPVAGPYTVIDTDYTTYSIVASCFLNWLDESDVWILSRSPDMSNATITHLMGVINELGFNFKDAVRTTQSGCWPEAETAWEEY